MTSTRTGCPISARTLVGKTSRRRMSITSHTGAVSKSGQHGMSSNLVSPVVVSIERSPFLRSYRYDCVVQMLTAVDGTRLVDRTRKEAFLDITGGKNQSS